MEKIKQFIDEFLTPEYLTLEATNRFYDYYDEDDLEEYDEEPLGVILIYEGEEIPGDINQLLADEIQKEFDIDIYDGYKDGEELQKYIIEKIRVVYPFYNRWHEMRMDQLRQQQELMDGFNNL